MDIPIQDDTTGCPKKTGISCKLPITGKGLKIRGLKIKVGWVFYHLSFTLSKACYGKFTTKLSFLEHPV